MDNTQKSGIVTTYINFTAIFLYLLELEHKHNDGKHIADCSQTIFRWQIEKNDVIKNSTVLQSVKKWKIDKMICLITYFPNTRTF